MGRDRKDVTDPLEELSKSTARKVLERATVAVLAAGVSLSPMAAYAKSDAGSDTSVDELLEILSTKAPAADRWLRGDDPCDKVAGKVEGDEDEKDGDEDQGDEDEAPEAEPEPKPDPAPMPSPSPVCPTGVRG